MDIDKMFNLPASRPGLGAKRKFVEVPNAEALKRFRVGETSDDVNVQTPRSVTVEDVRETDSMGRNEMSGQERDYDTVGDEEDDRFFGGGLNEEQNHILDIFDKAGDDVEGDGSDLSVQALRRLLGRFDRTVVKNAEQRGKFPDDPTRFIDSESDLDSMLKQFLPLTQNPSLYYPELVSSGAVALLANLLSHENTDIAVDVVEVLQELTDEDVGDAGDVDEANEGDSSNRLALAQLVDVLLEHSIFELLASNLERLNEAEETDQQGVFKVLGTFENLLSFMPPLADQIGSSTTMLNWLLKRMLAKSHDSNRQYASEILSILLHNSSANAEKLLQADGVDSLLRIVSQYQGRDPVDGEEEEFMENSFDCLCSVTALTDGKRAFEEAEGVELMILLMKEKRMARTRAVKVLDFACRTEAGTANCERFVEMLGLKTLFPLFMGKGESKKRRNIVPTFDDNEHLLGILASLFTNLASDTEPRIRLMAKFVQDQYEKVDRLLELREAAQSRLKPLDRQIAEERMGIESEGEIVDDDQEDEWYIARMDSGLSALQSADYVVAWICMEDDGVKLQVERLLGRKGETLHDVCRTLIEMSTKMGDGEPVESSDASQMRLVVEGLVTYLSG